jgi:serine/threonine protein kinase
MKVSTATPEYQSPEVLKYLHHIQSSQNLSDKEKTEGSQNLFSSLDGHSIDVWSLGITLLEILSGLPVWMQVETQVMKIDGTSITSSGILAVENRHLPAIIEKQEASI